MPTKPSKEELLSLVYQKFNTHAELDKFEDHDGDKVTIENERDLEEAFKIYYSLKESRPQLLHTLKLFLKRPSSSSLRNTEPASPLLPFQKERVKFTASSDAIMNTSDNQNYLRDYHSPMISTIHSNTPPNTPPVSFVEYHHGSSYGHDSISIPGNSNSSSNFPLEPQTRSRSFSSPAPPNEVDYMESHYQGGIPPNLPVPLQNSPTSVHKTLVSNPSTPYVPQHVPRNMDNVIWKKGQLLGCGGFGSVYLGLLDTGEIIAVKQIEFAHPGSDPTLIQKLEEAKQEIEIMKRLHHEHIVQYLGSQIQDNVISIFLE